MIAWRTALLAAAASFTLAGAVAAQEQPLKEPAEPAAPEDAAQLDGGGLDLAFNVGAATDYVFRGVSQTDEGPQVFGGVDAAFGGIGYAGVWASNVDFAPLGDEKTDAEVDLYAGVRPEAYGYLFDFAGIYYAYLGQPDGGAELSYFEAKAAVSRSIGPATLGGALYYSPEFTGEVGDALYLEVNGAFEASGRVTISGALGRQTFDELDGADYTTWNIGGTFALTEVVGVDLRYHDTDEDDLANIYDARVVASVRAAF